VVCGRRSRSGNPWLLPRHGCRRRQQLQALGFVLPSFGMGGGLRGSQPPVPGQSAIRPLVRWTGPRHLLSFVARTPVAEHGGCGVEGRTVRYCGRPHRSFQRGNREGSSVHGVLIWHPVPRGPASPSPTPCSPPPEPRPALGEKVGLSERGLWPLGSSAPGTWKDTLRPRAFRAGRPTYQLLRPYPNQLSAGRVPPHAVGELDLSVLAGGPSSPSSMGPGRRPWSWPSVMVR
jgi:hypothetical protein